MSCRPTAVYVRAVLDAGQLEGLCFEIEPGVWADDAAALAALGRPAERVHIDPAPAVPISGEKPRS